MSISPAIRLVFALAVALLSAAPVAARERAPATPLVWAPAPERVEAPVIVDPGVGPIAPQGEPSPTCFATPNDGATVFSSADAQAVRDALAAVLTDTVKVAGYCSGVASQGGTIQTALITKTITLAGGYTTTDWTSYDPVGNSTTLDALGGGRVIVASVAATLRGFTVTGGYISSAGSANGGGINAAGALTMSEMIVSGNTVTGTGSTLFGGGAYIGGAATVSATTFSNNVAQTFGGGLFAQSTLALSGTQFISNTATLFGGGAYASGAATLTGGVFQNNRGDLGAGGLYANTTLALTGTQFISNTAVSGGGNGGGARAGAATLNGGLFQNNSVGSRGGGLFVVSTLALSGTQFLSNTATIGGGGVIVFGEATLTGGVFQSNAGANGGGLFANSTLALTGTQFLGNTAVSGGGLYLTNVNARRVVNALFARNVATGNGAAIYVNDAAPLSLIHTSIVSPTAPAGATQAIYVNAGTVYLSNTLIATHTIGIGVAGGTVGDWNTLFSGVSTPYTGTITSAGGITGTAGFVNPAADDYHLGAGSAAINAGIDAGVYTDFEGDVRPQGGGFDIGYDEKAVAVLCYATPNDGTTVFSSADAQAVRDALAAAAANGTVKIAGYCAGAQAQSGTTQVAWITQTVTLEGGYTTSDWTTYNPVGNPTTLDALAGGRVISAPVAATLRGFTVTGGYISSTTGLNGGGISAVGAMTLTDMIVSGNIVTGASGYPKGGGAHIRGPALVTNSTFRNNASRNDGGGLYAASTLALTGTQFVSNTARGYGGGAAAFGATTLNGGLFQSNASGDNGGGLYALSTLALTGTQFVSNTTASSGGGAAAYGATTLNGGLFQSNASRGSGGGLLALSTLALTGMQFLSNTSAAGGGGGGAMAYDAATLTGGVFQSNAGGDAGGGLYALSTLALTGTQFLGNTAVSGGGLYLADVNARRVVNAPFARNADTSDARRVVNALFARNAATGSGAAIYVGNATPLSLIHTTIVSPTAPTSATEAIYIAAGTVYLSNTLIATHTIGIARAGGTASDWNTLFAGVGTPYSGTVTSVGGITGTAGFVNPAADDYHLGAGSAALNAGIDAGVLTDFEGDVRPQGAGFDIGYDESLSASPTCYATPNDGTTVFSSPDAQAVRDALAAAAANGTVKVAGYCAGVQAQGGTTQTAWITQTVTLEGGYTTSDWTTYNPVGNPTTLDALQGGRVISAPVAATLRGFTVTGGYISSTLSLNGGGISAVGAMTLTDMIVSGNIVTGASGSPRGGGAAFGGPAFVAATTFIRNVAGAGSRGGGAYFAAAGSIAAVTFVSNTANQGGGADFAGVANIDGSFFGANIGGQSGGAQIAGTSNISGSSFVGNIAWVFAGGGLSTSGNSNITASIFMSNSSAGFGGGFIASRAASLDRVSFIGNLASNGGAVALNTTRPVQVVNALFAGNRATTNGAAIYVLNAAPLSLIHATIVSPTAPTGGAQAVYAQAGTVYLSNTLIASHTIGIAQAGGTVEDWNTLFSGVSTPYFGTVTSVGGITGTAGFVNPAADDYHLGAGSAALNAGIDAGVYTDFDGDVRPQGGGFDIGYDESLSASPTWLITPTAGVGGAITPGTPQMVSSGGTVVFTITPDTGYHVLDVGVDGVSQGALGGYTFTNVTADHTITAAFAINTYTLTMTTTAFVINSNTPTVTTPGAGSAGITPTAGANLFTYGTVVTLTAAAQAGWAFAVWSGDADCADGVVTMTADLTCAARFETRVWYFPIMRK